MHLLSILSLANLPGPPPPQPLIVRYFYSSLRINTLLQ
jgi:hypothetical protein